MHVSKRLFWTMGVWFGALVKMDGWLVLTQRQSLTLRME